MAELSQYLLRKRATIGLGGCVDAGPALKDKLKKLPPIKPSTDGAPQRHVRNLDDSRDVAAESHKSALPSQ